MSKHSLEDIITAAQEVLDMHTYGATDGRCLACNEYECPHRENAIAIFARYRYMLPLRRPGRTQPELEVYRRAALPPAPVGGRAWMTGRFEGRRV